MRLCNFGSLNIDRVYRVPHIVRPGETLGSSGVRTFAGGKGANQSVALARAGAPVAHAGAVGADGRWLVEILEADGVETRWVEVLEDRPTGHAIIQIDEAGENAIVLDSGANHGLTPARIDHVLGHFEPGDGLLLQNEVNEVGYLIEAGARRGMRVCLNPAPMGEAVRDYPLGAVATLIVNESEGAALSGEDEPEPMARALQALGPEEVIVTLGSRGALYLGAEGLETVPGVPAQVVDTTAAGDTFIGYYLAARAGGTPVAGALARAARAAAACCAHPGAIDAIPLGGKLRGS